MSRERAELSKKNPYHIPRYRYYELKYFCRQYDDWKKALTLIDGWQISPNDISGIIKGCPPVSQTERIALSRVFYSSCIDIVDRCIAELDTALAPYIKKGVTEGDGYNKLQRRYFKMENYENKELLKDAAKKSLESLKDLKPGTEEYNTAANMALKLYDMQLKDEAQENEKQLKEDEAVRKVHELELDQEKAEKARKLDWAKIGMKALTFAGTIGMTVYWSICEAGGVTQLSRAISEGVHELKRGFTEKD